MKKLIKIPKDAEIPLIGLVQIGIIDRGTNLLQIRPTSICNLNCIFCSTDAGPFSKYHVCEYLIENQYLIDWLKEVIKFKGRIHAFLDSVGETLTHPKILDLISEISQLEGIETVAIETNGTLLNEEIVKEMEELKLARINLSLHALDEELNKKLVGCKEYNTERILELIKFISDSKIDLTLTPVWVPGLNDQEIPKIIEFAKKTIRNKKYPILGIQKYESHKFGRKPKNVKQISWFNFYKQLEKWEKEFGVKLKLQPSDFNIKKTNWLPIQFKVGEKVLVELKTQGWMENEMIGVAKQRSITVVDCKESSGKLIKVKILRNKDNIYIARK
ncbi:MAG: radical SAM protein [Candidatus Aenigmatarchaeota archaeon]